MKSTSLNGEEFDNPYGPNGDEVAAFIKRVKTLTPQEIKRLEVSVDAGYGQAPDFLVKRLSDTRNLVEAGIGMFGFMPQAQNAAAALEDGGTTDCSKMLTFLINNICGALQVREMLEPNDFDVLAKPWTDTLPATWDSPKGVKDWPLRVRHAGGRTYELWDLRENKAIMRAEKPE